MGEGKQKQEHINHDENPKKILEKYFVHIGDVHGRSTHQEKRFPSPMGKTEDGETQQHWDQQQTGNVFKIDEPHQIRGIRLRPNLRSWAVAGEPVKEDDEQKKNQGRRDIARQLEIARPAKPIWGKL